MGITTLLAALLAVSGTPTVTVDWIEVTQVVQDTANSVELVAGKPTVARVYVNTDNVASVVGWLRVRSKSGDTLIRSMNRMIIDPAMNATVRGARERNRSVLTGSLNFLLPPREGSVTLTLESVDGAMLSESAPRRSVTVAFVPMPVMHVCLVGLPYRISADSVLMPREVDYRLIRSWVSRTFPVDSIAFRTVVADTTGMEDVARNPDGGWAWLAVESIRAIDRSYGADRTTHYCGLIYDDGKHFTRGLTIASAADSGEARISFAPVGRPRGQYAWDTDSTYGDWYVAHELAHSYGCMHIGVGPDNDTADATYPFADGYLSDDRHTFAGFDAGDVRGDRQIAMAPVRPMIAHDLMSYSTHLWLSSHTYRALMRSILAEHQQAHRDTIVSALSDLVPLRSGFRDSAFCIHVVALVDTAAGTGSIGVVNHLDRRALSLPSAGHRAALRVRDTAGMVLYEHYARNGADRYHNADAPHLLFISALLADTAGIGSIELLYDGRLLDTWLAPTLEQPSDTAAIVTRDSATIHVRWPGLVRRSDESRYRIEESTDGGTSWQLLTLVDDVPEVRLNRADRPGVTSLRLQVVLDAGSESVRVAHIDLALP